ncbi:MAG: glycosyltransferase [Candidatus Parcubacteria bacterium]|nr:glycosyltransferase [Candidatus Parcubacteria bacterium]
MDTPQKGIFLSIIIPAYNEAGRISRTLQSIASYLSGKDFSCEVIVVDDGSTDGTLDIVRKNAGTIPNLRALSNGKNRGKGYSVRHGMLEARGEYCLFMDADNSVDISHFDAFIAEMRPGYDIAIGSIEVGECSVKEGAGKHRLILRAISKFPIRMLIPGIRDTQRGFKLFTAAAAKAIFSRQTIDRFGFDLEVLAIARRLNLKVKELPVVWDNPAGSKVTLGSYASTMVELVKIARMDMWERAKSFVVGTEDVRMQPLHDGLARGRGFVFKGNEFIHHSGLDHRETALQSFVRHQKFFMAAFGIVMAGLFILNWHLMLVIIFSTLTVVYFLDLLFNMYIIYKSFKTRPEITASPAELAALSEADLPMYTIFCPLYKEWQVVPQFAEAMSKLDYPKNKLQIMFLLEENDKETVRKVREANLPSQFEIVVVPHSKPKTKPKAMNYGLQFARGEYLVIYDAEDKPEVDQLKKALVSFKKSDPRIICVQAKLNFYNPTQNILTRVFTAEYSLWFDLVLPGLQSIGAPIPLGGTSNHFKVNMLRELDGWDAFNVTEDCDLGMRIAKRGYKTAIVESTTHEEANSHYFNWLSQRSRWIKGYIQTYLVHMRRPQSFIEAGKTKDLIAFQAIVGGKVLSLFINPIMWAITICYFLFRAHTAVFIESLFPGPVLTIGVLSLVFGNFLYLYYYMIGCAKRDYNSLLKYVFLIPFYWLSMSLASWRSVYEVIVKPHYWAKTRHGLHLAGAEGGVKESEVEEPEDVRVEAPKKVAPVAPAPVTAMPAPVASPISMPAPAMASAIPAKAIPTKTGPSRLKSAYAFVSSGPGFLVASTVIANFINFAFNAFLGRSLSFGDFGVVTLMTTFASILGIAASALGMTVNHTVSYLEGLGKGRGISFFKSKWFSVFLSSLAVMALWIVSASLIREFFNVSSTLIVIAFAPAIVLESIDSLNKGFLQGLFNFKMIAAIVLIEVLAKFGIAVAMVGIGMPQLAALAIPGSIVCVWLASSYGARKAVRVNAAERIVPSRKSFPFGFYFASLLSGLSITVFLSMDILFAKHFLSIDDAGKYSMLSLVGKMIYFFGSLFNTFIVTYVSRAEGRGKNPNKDFMNIFGATAFLTISAATVLGFFAGWLVPFLLGARAAAIVPYVPLYAFAITLFTFSMTIVTYQLARRKYLFSALSLLASLGMCAALYSAHGSIGTFVDVVVWANAAFFALVVGLNVSHKYFLWIGRNIMDVLRVFKSLPEASPALPECKHILIFNWRDTESVFAGGAETYIQSLASRWVKDGHSVTLFTSNDGHQQPNGWISGVRIIRRGGFYGVYACAALYYMFKLRGKFDAIIDCENGIPFFTPLYAKEPVFCLIHHIHQDIFRQYLMWPLAKLASFLEKDLMPLVYRHMRFITVSESSKKDMEALHITDKPVEIVYPGVDTKFLTPGMKSATPLVSYVGRIRAYKSVDVLARAFVEVRKAIPAAKLVIAGDGDGRDKLVALLRKLDLGDSITLLGKVSEEEKRRILRESWISVNPSSMEGWGITSIEANACGTPVIASNVPGLRDSVRHGKNGLLVPHGDVAAFASNIIDLLSDAELRSSLSLESVAWAQNFTWQKSSEEFIRIVSRPVANQALVPEKAAARVPAQAAPVMPVSAKPAFSFFVAIRRLVYLSLGMIGRFSYKEEKGVIVLCYHSVASDPWRFSVDFKDLQAQVAHLLEHRKPVTAKQLEMHINGRKALTEPSFLIAFDDGYRDLLTTKSYFRELGIKPVVFVLANSDKADRHELDTNRPFLSVAEIGELKAAGWEIGCHGATHRDFKALTARGIYSEIIQAKAKLEKTLGYAVNYFAYPKGVYTPDILETVKRAGYDMAFSMDNGYVTENTNPIIIPRIGVDRTHSFKEFRVLASPFIVAVKFVIDRVAGMIGLRTKVYG